MKKLLLVTGDLATGKSTFSDLISDKYRINIFHKDTIKEVLGDTIGFANREENLKLSKATMELMFFIFTEFTKKGSPLILESNFHQADIEKFQRIAIENGYEVMTLVFRGDIEILHKRYLNRMYNESRHPVHLSTTFHIFEDFENYIKKSREENIEGNVIYINADDFMYQSDEGILQQIDKFLR